VQGLWCAFRHDVKAGILRRVNTEDCVDLTPKSHVCEPFSTFHVLIDPLQNQIGDLQILFVLHQHVTVPKIVHTSVNAS